MDIREKIIHEATRLFAARGVDGASLQDIADKVGVAKASLLYHYPSKEELHKSVLESLLSRWNDIVPQLLHAVARENRFDALLDATIEFFLTDPDRARLLLRETLDRPVEMRELLQRHVTTWIGLIADSIRKAKAAGGMRKDVDPHAYVLHVVNLVIGTFTTGVTLAPLLGEKDVLKRLPDARLLGELKRIARVSLFPKE